MRTRGFPSCQIQSCVFFSSFPSGIISKIILYAISCLAWRVTKQWWSCKLALILLLPDLLNTQTMSDDPHITCCSSHCSRKAINCNDEMYKNFKMLRLLEDNQVPRVAQIEHTTRPKCADVLYVLKPPTAHIDILFLSACQTLSH